MEMSSDETSTTSLAHVQESTKPAKPKDESLDQRIKTVFAKWLEPVEATGDDGSAKSRVIDSREMESFHRVDHLTKRADGTTVVRYYFPSDIDEVNGICASDARFHPECMPLLDDKTKALAREAMKAIVGESGARIDFQEVPSLDNADIAFVKSSGALSGYGIRADGYAGRAADRNYIVDGMGGSSFRQLMEEAFNELPPEQQDKFREQILQKYGSANAKDTDIFTILTSEREKMIIAHEIEHTLGAGHPDAGAGLQPTKQTIMGDPVLGSDRFGKLLGNLDVEWYQRHFGVNHLPESASPDPLSIPIAKARQGYER
jgi:hypothetical protein